MLQEKFEASCWLLILLLMLSCSAQQSATEKTPSTEKEKTKEKAEPSPYPAWYSVDMPRTADSSGFSGYGMAVTSDSSSSLEQSLRQAQTQLRRAVDDSLEKVRTRLIEAQSEGSGSWQQTEFIVTLRNSVNFVDQEATVVDRNVERKNNRWISFVKARISWDTVIRRLKEPLADYPDFYEALKKE